MSAPRPEKVDTLVSTMLESVKQEGFTGDELVSAVFTLLWRTCKVTLQLTQNEVLARHIIEQQLQRLLAEFGGSRTVN